MKIHRSTDKPRHRKRFALIDLQLVDEALLYSDSAGKQKLGLLLEVERQANGEFLVRQAASSKMTRAGVRGKILGSWKFLNKKWSENRKARRSEPC